MRRREFMEKLGIVSLGAVSAGRWLSTATGQSPGEEILGAAGVETSERPKGVMIQYEVVPKMSQLYFVFQGTEVGQCRLWLPEGIGTPRGLAGVYPHGMIWQQYGCELRQEATVSQVFGPGNVNEIEPGILQCCGIRYVKEAPLPWTSSIVFHDRRMAFSLSVHNPHEVVLSDVCALLCLKFMDASWWNPSSCFFMTERGVKSIAQTEWINGRLPHFQKWHVGSEVPYDNPVMNGIWTSNSIRIVSPMWAIRPQESDCAIVFSCEAAYYIHCNRGNPCNDIALKFGDVQPGQTIERRGYVELAQGRVEELLHRTIWQTDAGDALERA